MKTTSKSRRNARGRDGTSLLEVMVALFVFGAFVSGACRLGVMSRRVSDVSRSHYQAINIAKNRMERAKTLGFDFMDQCEENRVRVDCAGSPDPGGAFRRSTVVNTLGPDMKEMVVSVDILDRVTLRFQGSQEEIRSCIARFQYTDA